MSGHYLVGYIDLWSNLPEDIQSTHCGYSTTVF